MDMKQELDIAIAKGGKFRTERRRFVQEYEWIARSLLDSDSKQRAQAQAPTPAPPQPRYDRYQPTKESPQNGRKPKAPAKAPASGSGPGPTPARYDRYEPPKHAVQKKRTFEGKPSQRGGKKQRKN